jgi:hypothetical protein
MSVAILSHISGNVSLWVTWICWWNIGKLHPSFFFLQLPLPVAAYQAWYSLEVMFDY